MLTVCELLDFLVFRVAWSCRCGRNKRSTAKGSEGAVGEANENDTGKSDGTIQLNSLSHAEDQPS